MASEDEVKIKSNFHLYREQYHPRIPALLKKQELGVIKEDVPVEQKIKDLFPVLTKTSPHACYFTEAEPSKDKINTPLRIGCVLSGGQAAGGHNVIVGIYEQIKKRNINSQLFGFMEGPIGIIKGNYIELRDETISFYKNRGGFDMIRSGRNKIEKPEEFKSSLKYCKALNLDGLVVIGGDDSNTNACLLAEYFLANGCTTKVIGCPKTIDGDLKNDYIEVSFGFDTACKTYSELIGNLMMDTLSTKKYYHFIRLMGRSASHIALECALLTRPNYTFIGEEVHEKKISLQKIVDDLVDTIIKRSQNGKDYGIILVPEGIVEFIDEMGILIGEINQILATTLQDNNLEVEELSVKVQEYLTKESAQLLKYLPKTIAEQLLLDRDPHGNVQVAKIESERLLISICEKELDSRKAKGQYKGKFAAQSHYFGYEGRCAFPSNFDCDYCYSLGVNAAILIEKGFTGVMSCIRYLYKDPEEWIPSGTPLVTMMTVEKRKDAYKPVIRKALTDLNGELFQVFCQEREAWAMEDYYRQLGPIQFEFRCYTPFLVKSPTYENLYHLMTKDYDPNNKPFHCSDPSYMSDLQFHRLKSRCALPSVLSDRKYVIAKQQSLKYSSEEVKRATEEHFKRAVTESSQLVEIIEKSQINLDHKLLSRRQHVRIGICFNGRQAPGGNDIVGGLLRFCNENDSELIGFVGGTKGLLNGNYISVNDNNFEYFHHQGGYTFLGRSVDKLRDPEELQKTKQVCEKLKLDGLVLVGASHTFTDALIITDFFLENKVQTCVIAVPATIDNNIGHHMLESVVGFDTASKLYSQLIGNIMIDAASAIKYWYFIRLMGRDPSHLVLECALQTRPNICLISEEIAQKGWNILDVVNYITDIVIIRLKKRKNFGTVLVPEGLLAHIPEFKSLIEELNNLFANKPLNEQDVIANKLIKEEGFAHKVLSPWTAGRFTTLPEFCQKQLVMEREVNGSVQLSQIETERLLSYLVEIELKIRLKEVKFSFSAINHFFGYQGRCAMPSLFDSELAICYGYTAGVLIEGELTGYCTTARGLCDPVNEWHVGAIPLVNMTSLKSKSSYGTNRPLIKSHEVDLNQGAFIEYKNHHKEYILVDYYSNPGPTQFYGKMSEIRTLTLKYENENYLSLIKQIEEVTQKINSQCRFGTHQDLLRITISNLQNVMNTLEVIKHKYV